jgi:hypothetical protein
VERQNEATTGFGDNSLWIYFTFQAHRSPSKARHSSERAGMHGMPLDALHRSVPTLRRMVFSRRIKFLLTATFVGLHRWGDVLRM